MEYERIEKSIYGRPDIGRRLRPQPASLIIIATGLLCGWMATLVRSNGVQSLLLFVAGSGAFTLILLLCYYLFGDSRRPYYKPSHALLEPEYLFYSSASKAVLLEALSNGDKAAVERVKKGSIPELVLVRYSNNDDSVVFQQLQQPYGKTNVAISNISISINNNQ